MEQRTPRRSKGGADRRAARAVVEDVAVVLAHAARLLEARARTVAELERRLRTAGYREGLVQGALDRLGDLGMLDDEAFARAWVESRDRAQPRGARALRDELRRKGVAADLIAETLAQREAEGSSVPARKDAQPDAPVRSADAAAAARLLEASAGRLGREADPSRRLQRAYALLARRGFDPSTAREAVSEAALRWGGVDGDGLTAGDS